MANKASHLVIVCCHGIWKGGTSNGHDEAEWLIADFQRGETNTFMKHIELGVKCWAEDRENALLVFSGGPTRRETQLSEARSYLNVATANGLLHNSPVPDSILLEERALDSYHNILFSLTLFYRGCRRWPSRLTVVSHGFKRERLVDGHCAALGFPLTAVRFVGADPPGMAVGEASKAVAMKGVGEAVDDWRVDPHGKGEKLAGKRARRNPWGTWQGVFEEDGGEGGSKGGLVTVGHGVDERVDEAAPRPWSEDGVNM